MVMTMQPGRSMVPAADALPEVLPTEWFDKAEGSELDRARAVCDYIAGMTDRYAIEEHKRLFRLDVGHEV